MEWLDTTTTSHCIHLGSLSLSNRADRARFGLNGFERNRVIRVNRGFTFLILQEITEHVIITYSHRLLAVQNFTVRYQNVSIIDQTLFRSSELWLECVEIIYHHRNEIEWQRTPEPHTTYTPRSAMDVHHHRYSPPHHHHRQQLLEHRLGEVVLKAALLPAIYNFVSFTGIPKNFGSFFQKLTRFFFHTLIPPDFT